MSLPFRSSPYSRRAQELRSTLREERARAMRSALTHSESLLWRELRGNRLGIRFVRQFVVGRFIADFAAPSARLIVEVDGAYHARRSAADARRDKALRQHGFHVLRLSARLVESQVSQAVAAV